MTKKQLIEALEALDVPDDQEVLITINTRKGAKYTIFTDIEDVEERKGLIHIITLDWRHGG